MRTFAPKNEVMFFVNKVIYMKKITLLTGYFLWWAVCWAQTDTIMGQGTMSAEQL